MAKDITRRGAVTLAGAAAVAACKFSNTAMASEPTDDWWLPKEWEGEADAVIVGYGGAGATAAIAVATAGGTAIVLEKSPERDGGNTGCSSGMMHTAVGSDPEEWYRTYAHGSFGCGAPEGVIRAYIDAANSMPDWLDQNGISINWSETEDDGHKRPAKSMMGLVSGQEGSEGRFLFKAIDDVVSSLKGVDVRIAMRAAKLVQDPRTKEVLGVIAQDAEGGQHAFKARKGVVLACGGYETNPEMQHNYNQPGVRDFAWGTIYNTGDGFPMAMQAGCKLWHMHALEHAAPCFELPSEEANCSISVDATTGITPFNYIFVDFNGKRFMRDDKTAGHDMEHKPALDFSNKGADFLHLPYFMIFDSTIFNAGPLWKGTGRDGIVNTFAGVYNATHPDNPLLEWKDNDQAIEKGWIFKGDTLEELASNIRAQRPCGVESEAIEGIDANALIETVETFNGYVAAGEDPDFGRSADKMGAIDQPPYYAIQMGFSTINTQGGPVRNEHCQTMGFDDEPIPRLYNVGEFGSYNGYVYNCGNIIEALTTGRMAGEHLVTLSDWDI